MSSVEPASKKSNTASISSANNGKKLFKLFLDLSNSNKNSFKFLDFIAQSSSQATHSVQAASASTTSPSNNRNDSNVATSPSSHSQSPQSQHTLSPISYSQQSSAPQTPTTPSTPLLAPQSNIKSNQKQLFLVPHILSGSAQSTPSPSVITAPHYNHYNNHQMHQMSPVFNNQQGSAFDYEGSQSAMLANLASAANQFDQPHIHHTNLPRMKELEKNSNKILDLETKHMDRQSVAAASMAN